MKRNSNSFSFDRLSKIFTTIIILLFVQTYAYGFWDNSIKNKFPGDNATNVKLIDSLVIEFENPVTSLNGSLIIFDDESHQIDIIDLTSTQVKGKNSHIITIGLNQPLDSLTSYYIKISHNAFGDGFTGITDNLSWNFSTWDILNEIHYSEEAKTDYKLFIAYPESYNPLRSTAYPTIYILDGNWNSSTCLDYLKIIRWGDIPDAIIVGIGYPNVKNPNTERERDLLFSNHADNFFRYQKNELLPYIDGTYNTDPKSRTLIGYSYGGAYSIYATLQYKEPSNRIYKNILAGDPSLWVTDSSNRLIDDFEEMYFQSTDSLPVNLFLTTASDFDNSNREVAERWNKLLLNRQYKELNYHFWVIPNSNHGTAANPSYTESILWFFNQVDIVVFFPKYPAPVLYCDALQEHFESATEPAGGFFTGFATKNGKINPENLQCGNNILTYNYPIDGRVLKRTAQVSLKPLYLSLNNLKITKQSPQGTIIDTFKLKGHFEHEIDYAELVEGNGIDDVDNNKFKIEKNKLIIKDSLNYNAQHEYNIYVKALMKDNTSLYSHFRLELQDPVKVDPFLNSKFVLYPNPAKDKFFIKHMSLNTDASVDIYDVFGKNIYTAKLKPPGDFYEIAYLTAGIYYVKVNFKTQKLLIE